MVHGCEELLIELIAQCNHTMCVCPYVYVYVCTCVWTHIGMSRSKFGGIGKAQLVRNAASLHGTCLEHCSALYSAAFSKTAYHG